MTTLEISIAIQLKKYIFFVTYVFERHNHRGRETERDLLFIGSLSKCPQKLRRSQAASKRQELHLGLPRGKQGPSTWAISHRHARHVCSWY